MKKNSYITNMSSKGQVVIPEPIRKRLKLEKGTQFFVIGNADIIILKVATPPNISEFDMLIEHARNQANEAGLRQKDVTLASAKLRGRK